MADLFTLAELASYLQRDIDTATATLAQSAGQGLVRAYTRQNIDTRTYTSTRVPVTIHGERYTVLLPQRPVTAVTSVTVNGTAYVAGADYTWDGVNARLWLRYLAGSSTSFIDEWWAVVTYTAGYATVPDAVKGVALSVAGRAYDNPRGIRSEAIDDYSATRAGADDDLAGVTLTAAEMAALRPYRAGAGSLVPL